MCSAYFYLPLEVWEKQITPLDSSARFSEFQWSWNVFYLVFNILKNSPQYSWVAKGKKLKTQVFQDLGLPWSLCHRSLVVDAVRISSITIQYSSLHAEIKSHWFSVGGFSSCLCTDQEKIATVNVSRIVFNQWYVGSWSLGALVFSFFTSDNFGHVLHSLLEFSCYIIL